MLRRHERLGASHRAAAVRARPVGGDLRARKLVPAEPHPPGEARHRHRKRGVHQEVTQPVPHVRRPGQHGGSASPL